jgi:hypothetical protein
VQIAARRRVAVILDHVGARFRGFLRWGHEACAGYHPLRLPDGWRSPPRDAAALPGGLAPRDARRRTLPTSIAGAALPASVHVRDGG